MTYDAKLTVIIQRKDGYNSINTEGIIIVYYKCENRHNLFFFFIKNQKKN